jgi:Fe2+ or Zn2+ uptake regulation protein
VICRGCGSVREFEAALLGELAREAAASVPVDSISVEIFGKCDACSS